MRQLCTGQKARFVSFVVCLLLTLTRAQVVCCQPPIPPAEPGSQLDCLNDLKCSELYQNARRLSKAEQYEAALVTYQSAYAQRPTLWLLVNIGRMQQKSGRLQQAIRTFKRFIDDPLAKADQELRNKARAYLQQAEEEATAQQPRTAVTPPSAAKEKAPIYKKWWFWTALGGAAAVAALGLGVGLATSSNSPGIPSGAATYAPTF